MRAPIDKCPRCYSVNTRILTFGYIGMPDIILDGCFECEWNSGSWDFNEEIILRMEEKRDGIIFKEIRVDNVLVRINENKRNVDNKVKFPRFGEWFRELNNPENEQGYGWLYNEGKYCCLGLLCKVQGVLRLNEGSSHWADISNPKEHTYSFLSHDNEVYGIISSMGEIDGVYYRIDGNPETYTILAGLNDSELVSFSTIAKILQIFFEE